MRSSQRQWLNSTPPSIQESYLAIDGNGSKSREIVSISVGKATGLDLSSCWQYFKGLLRSSIPSSFLILIFFCYELPCVACTFAAFARTVHCIAIFPCKPKLNVSATSYWMSVALLLCYVHAYYDGKAELIHRVPQTTMILDHWLLLNKLKNPCICCGWTWCTLRSPSKTTIIYLRRLKIRSSFRRWEASFPFLPTSLKSNWNFSL